MNKRLYAWGLILLLAIGLTGCGAAATQPTATPAPTETPIPPTATTPAESMEASGAASEDENTEDAADAQPSGPDGVTIGADEAVLAWTVTGVEAPGLQGASNPGQLVLVDAAGAFSPVMDLPEGIRRVAACGDAATSPDGEYFAFYAGIDTGSLYLMSGQETPTMIDTVHEITCLGSGTLRYSPDSSRLGYIIYEPGGATNDFVAGEFKVYNTDSGATAFEVDGVTAFDLSDDAAVFVSFFTDDQGRATEAAVQIWDGSNEREVATLQPDSEDCRFVSASVQILSGTQLSLVLGHRCDVEAVTSWKLYGVNIEERSVTLAASEPTVGGYQSFARTNAQFVVPGGDAFLFTVPDGVTANTAGMYLVDAADLTPSLLVERQLVMPTTTTPANATPRLSPDGRWLAMVQTTPNSENTLTIFDLSDMSLTPIEIEAGNRGDTVSAMAFTGDSARLIAVIGGDEGADNSVIAVTLGTGSDFRIDRGRFNNTLVVSPDGDGLVVGDTQVTDDNDEPTFLNLVAIGVDSSESVTLFEGAEVTDGEVGERSFTVPLAWR